MTRKHERTETSQKTGGTPGKDGMAQAKNILCSCNWSTGYMRAEDAELLIMLHLMDPEVGKEALLRNHHLDAAMVSLRAVLKRLSGTDRTVLVEDIIENITGALDHIVKARPQTP